tara:strand:+ start:2456 stop:2692 length:237 start_codon:yes stop_codon:yes gene_type:complete
MLVHESGHGDYYEGVSSAIYVDGELVWEGTSCDAVQSILKAVLPAFIVAEGKRTDFEWPKRFEDVDFDFETDPVLVSQ